MRYRRLIILLLILTFCLLALSASTAFSRFTLLLDDIKHPVFEAQSIRVQFSDLSDESGQLEIVIARIELQDYIWTGVRLSCSAFLFANNSIQCKRGSIMVPGFLPLPVSLSFYSDTNSLEINFNPGKNENWQLKLWWDETAWQSVIAFHNAQLSTIAAWIPNLEQLPQPKGGRVNGTIRLSGDKSNLRTGIADLSVDTLAFSDQMGLRAGENIKFTVKANLKYVSRLNGWQWESDIHWQQGEVFWQPIYLIGNGHNLSLSGFADSEKIRFKDCSLVLTDIGIFDFSGLFNFVDRRLDTFKLESEGIALSVIYNQLLKPLLQDTAFADMEVAGQIDLSAQMDAGELRSVSIGLDEISIDDQRKRFAFHRLNAHIPWESDNATIADIRLLHGQILSIPIGEVRVPLEINGRNLYLPQLTLPVLNGLLKLEAFNADYTETGWRWGFNGELSEVSMKALTEALQVQPMRGTVSGLIPDVRYDGSSVTVNGILQLNVFDGSIVIHNMKLIEPMGLAPHLKADIAMRDLDLELLTGTFSFGKVQGRIDVDVLNFELANWKPVHFDARLLSSPGNYPRRISQAAIENISALGGEGAMVAIQRSFLRFFEEFRYSKIGWRCALRLDVCYMGGIETTPQFRYTLVKGGGIPAITVIGYNQKVGWQELIDRLQRITSENEPIIQ